MARQSKLDRIRAIEKQIALRGQSIDVACRFRVYTRENGKLVPTDTISGTYGARYHALTGRRVGDAVDVREYRCTKAQFDALNTDAKKVFCSGGRGAGKSELLTLLVIRAVCRNPRSYIPAVSPTYKKCKIVWRKVLRQVPVHWLLPGKHGVRLADKQLRFVHGTTLEFFSADNPDSIRGEDGSEGVVDEAQDVSVDAYDNLRLTLRTTLRWAMYFVGTMKMGSDFHVAYQRAQEDPNAACFQMSSFDNCFIPQGEGSIYEDARATMDSRRYDQEVRGLAVSLEGLVYHPFNRFVHCKPMMDFAEDTTRQISRERFNSPSTHLVGVSYHLAPMAAVVCQVRGDQLCVVDEIVLDDNASVTQLAKRISMKYPNALVCDSAPKDKLGGTSSGKLLRVAGLKITHPRREVLRIDRVNALNARLENADGERFVHIDPKCTRTVQALESYELDAGRVPIPQGNAVLTDALSLVAYRLWPPQTLDKPQVIMAA